MVCAVNYEFSYEYEISFSFISLQLCPRLWLKFAVNTLSCLKFNDLLTNTKLIMLRFYLHPYMSVHMFACLFACLFDCLLSMWILCLRILSESEETRAHCAELTLSPTCFEEGVRV